MKADGFWVAVGVGLAIAAAFLGLAYVVVAYLYPKPNYDDPLAKQKQSCLFCEMPVLREHRSFGRDDIRRDDLDLWAPPQNDAPSLVSERRPRVRAV